MYYGHIKTNATKHLDDNKATSANIAYHKGLARISVGKFFGCLEFRFRWITLW